MHNNTKPQKGRCQQQKRKRATQPQKAEQHAITVPNTSKRPQNETKQTTNKQPPPPEPPPPTQRHAATTPAPEETALTFGTLLSSQRTDAHLWRSFDRLRGNLIYVTGWLAQLPNRLCPPFPTLTGVARASPPPGRGGDHRGVPRAVQLRWILAIRPLCGSPWGLAKVTAHRGERQTRRSGHCNVVQT